jgi:hypothetical protein
MVKKPPERFARQANGNQLQETPPFLRVSEKPRANREFPILTGALIGVTQPRLPGGILVVAGDVSLEPFEIFVNERRLKTANGALYDYPFMHFHVLGVGRILE